jgi:hypothetical protein
LYVSGYADDVLPHDVLEDSLALLEKPYTAQSLEERVRMILGERRAAYVVR